MKNDFYKKKNNYKCVTFEVLVNKILILLMYYKNNVIFLKVFILCVNNNLFFLNIKKN